ncbi:transcriptional repressor [Peptoniphilus sp. MSJ-1]|uniref:Transcriptional repressor n=1 Tax=Peptoniphilus ovalis TaxID=2841503 RepID=A0ABS6FIY4_9FIRM|nr:Fur family transcriptional regulator [Peptoniphilus ovalis]MBU5670109.1 transcriptional repressor [Peptoniphilus ovalis]
MLAGIDQVKEILKENGYKYTSQRAKVFETFVENSDKHLTTEEVYNLVSKKYPELGIATVYRNVSLFTKLGILDQIIFDDNIVRYELRMPHEGHRHHHLICMNCGKVEEFDVDNLDEVEKEIEEKKNFKIIDHTLKFMGYCEDCQKIEEKAKLNEKQ